MDAVKQEIRLSVWRRLEEKNLVLFPKPVYGRIPNFKGAEEAALRLRSSEVYQKASVVKVNPDSPQRPVRESVLRDQKTLIFPTPRIGQGFLVLDPFKIPRHLYREASSIAGAFKYGVKIHPRELPQIDLVVTGSVAVTETGWRVGKGEGYSEIEYALLRTFGKVNDKTPVVTTVHDLQVVDFIPAAPFDLPLDYIFTNSRTIVCPKNKKPAGIYWELLGMDKIKAIPLLAELKAGISGAEP